MDKIANSNKKVAERRIIDFFVVLNNKLILDEAMI